MFFVPSSHKFSTLRTVLCNRGLANWRIGVLGVALIPVLGQGALAGEKLYFSGVSSAPNVSRNIQYRGKVHHRFSHRGYMRDKNVNHSYRNRWNYRRNSYRKVRNRGGIFAPHLPHVIDVAKVLARRNLRIVVSGPVKSDPSLTPHLAEYGPGQPRVLYYDETACLSGLGCTIKLGDRPSSPKIIVVGEKKHQTGKKPFIVYPPS